jgi:hypothetical protein
MLSLSVRQIKTPKPPSPSHPWRQYGRHLNGKSAQSLASCRRSGCSPAEPYPPHECYKSTRSMIYLSLPGKGDISTLH